LIFEKLTEPKEDIDKLAKAVAELRDEIVKNPEKKDPWNEFFKKGN